MKILVSLVSFLTITSVGYSSLAAICSDPLVQDIQLPRNAEEGPSSPTFAYHFKVLGNLKDDENPVVIFIPGGPGSSSIGTFHEGLPESATLILTDPRGGGCNATAGLGQNEISTALIAQDISLLIRNLGLKNYILYGVSYGTLVATEAAASYEKFRIPPPRSVVLEGAVGRKLERDQITPAVSAINNEILVFFGLVPTENTLDEHINLVSEFDYYGFPYPLSLTIPELVSDTLVTEFDPTTNKFYLGVSPYYDHSASLFSSEVNEAIWCREVSDYSDQQSEEFALKDGKLNVSYPACESAGSHYFDAAEWKITSPVYYFSGTWDSAVPVFQQDYHFSTQTQSPGRVHVIVEKGGHHSLQFSLADCHEGVWNSIFRNDVDGLQKSLKQCRASTKLVRP